MRFVFSERKAAQAAAQLLLLHAGHSMDLYRLLKLLYLADRRSLVETGYTITGDKMVSMSSGPVLSTIYDAIKDETGLFHDWSSYVGRGEGHRVFLKNGDPDSDELSPYERRLLAETHSNYGTYTFSAFRDFTHELAEWRDPHGSSLPIEPSEILRHEKVPAEQVEEIEALAEERWRLAEIFGRAS